MLSYSGGTAPDLTGFPVRPLRAPEASYSVVTYRSHVHPRAITGQGKKSRSAAQEWSSSGGSLVTESARQLASSAHRPAPPRG
jgi:hypothetical protein